MARFFCIFHALSFELNFFFNRRVPFKLFFRVSKHSSMSKLSGPRLAIVYCYTGLQF